MKYLKKFETEADKNDWLEGSEFVTPNVVLTGEVVGYNEEIDFSLLPLHIEAIEDLTISFSNNYEYSKDISTWSSGTSSTSISANAGEKVYFRASGLQATSEVGIGRFTISAPCRIAGNVMSMLYGDDYMGADVITQSHALYKLFINQQNIYDARSLVLPATTLANYCYNYLFSGCTNLVNAPALPATALARSCYSNMFNRCTSLVNAPALPATTLANYCYSSMFYGCTSLVNAPELPATALAQYCYWSMFEGCSNLDYIKMMSISDGLGYTYTNKWTSGVKSSGTFVKNADATWENSFGTSAIPSGWTVEMASA